MSTDKSLVAALQALWDIPPPGPLNLWSSREFVALKELLTKRYRSEKSTFGLEASIGNALRSLGLPCSTPHLLNQPRPDMDKVAATSFKGPPLGGDTYARLIWPMSSRPFSLAMPG